MTGGERREGNGNHCTVCVCDSEMEDIMCVSGQCVREEQ